MSETTEKTATLFRYVEEAASLMRDLNKARLVSDEFAIRVQDLEISIFRAEDADFEMATIEIVLDSERVIARCYVEPKYSPRRVRDYLADQVCDFIYRETSESYAKEPWGEPLSIGSRDARHNHVEMLEWMPGERP